MDVENPKTWRRYRQGMCCDCRAGCCTLIVEVTGADLICLGLTDDWEVTHSIKSLIKRLKKEGIIKRYNFKTGIFVLEQNSQGECIFLDTKQNCRVYEKRPMVCRKHPVEIGPRPGYCSYSPIL
jgi:Fe-S-cluster containining protein